jgi:amino acid transporter/nucleotide-binding universal stress UspA family protein
MLVTSSERPRELKWYHAGPMLYGDWGTSRFYVLGIALALSLHASFYYVLAVGLLVAAVGWAYTIICRCYPDGGGVYSAARHTSKNLAVVGALLLFADYIVTAAMSAYDGIRYMGLEKAYVPYIAMLAIVVVGIINYIGPKKAGTIALFITLATLILTAILTVFSLKHVAAGWTAVHKPIEPLSIQWSHFVGVVLALSGVEAIANMTGIMVPPVTRTANKAIWPVLIEVVILNLVLAVAMNGLPASGYDLGVAPKETYDKVEQIQHDHPQWQTDPVAQRLIKEQADLEHVDPSQITHRSEELKDHQELSEDAVLRVMAVHYVSPWFGWICGFVFGALLLSAVNTAVADMISIQYVMSRDTELPHVITKLNKFGVPWLALIAAVGLPVVILTIFQDVATLSNLYAVGVVGAIAINLGSCSYNKEMPIKKWERTCLAVLAVIMICIEATLVWDKPDARYFAGFVLFSGLAARFFTKTYPLLSSFRRALSLTAWAVLLITLGGLLLHFQEEVAMLLHDNVVLFKFGKSSNYGTYVIASLLLMFGGTSATYAARYFSGKVPIAAPAPARMRSTSTGLSATTGTAPGDLDMARPHVLVATRGGRKLLQFAANYCHKTNSLMFVLFVRQINVIMMGDSGQAEVNEDPEALKAFALAAEICEKHGVQMLPIYVLSSDIPYTILDFAATYNVEAVLMGVSREGTILRALRGDVITAVADHLPEDISLLIHA